MELKDINFALMPQTAVNIATRPADFFQKMSKTGGFLEPLVFCVVMGLISGVIQAILGFMGHAGSYGVGTMSSFGVIVFMPIAAGIGSFIGAAILFVIWKIIGSQENYETAYRCSAYLMVLAPITAIIGVVPYAGGIINMGIYVFYLVAASIHAHNISAQKAWLVFGIIGLIFALLGLRAEYSARNMSSAAEHWRKAAEESTKAMEKSAEEMQKQVEKMAKQFQKQAE